MNEVDDTIRIFWEMLDLDPNDNQGIRMNLALILVQEELTKDYEKLASMYEGEATALWLFLKAIHHYRRNGPRGSSVNSLRRANKRNPTVLRVVAGKSSGADLDSPFSIMGSPEEALDILEEITPMIMQTKGMREWMIKYHVRFKQGK